MSSCACSSASRTSSGILRDGAMFISPRIWRTLRMNSFMQAHLRLGVRVARVIAGRRVGREHQAVHGFLIGARLLRGEQRRRQRMHALPDFFGDERHHRMQRAQQRFEHRHQRAARAALLRLGGRLTLQDRLRQLQVPVAELVPGEFVQRGRGEVEAVLVERAIYLRERGGESRDDPAIRDGQFGGADQIALARLRLRPS